MSDILGQADRVTAMMTDSAITTARNLARVRELEPKGVCYNCNERTTNRDQLFCDADCANDHAMLQRNKRL